MPSARGDERREGGVGDGRMAGRMMADSRRPAEHTLGERSDPTRGSGEDSSAAPSDGIGVQSENGCI